MRRSSARKMGAGVLAVVLTAWLAACGSSNQGGSQVSDPAAAGSANSSATAGSSPASSSSSSAGSSSSSPTAGSSKADETSTSSATDSSTVPEPADMSNVSIAFANLTDAGELTQTMKKSIVDASAKVGAKLTTYDNKFDSTTTLQNAKLIALDKPDMALEWNPVAATAKAVEQQFQQAGVDCIAVNTPGDGGCAWFNLNNPTLCGDSGKAMGKAASDRGWTGSDTTVLLVSASKMGETTNSCLADFYYQLQSTMPGLDEINSPSEIKLTTTTIGGTGIQIDTGDGTRAQAYDGVKQALQSIPKDRNVILYTLSDDAARGGWRAVEEADRADTSITGGLGGDAAALKELRTNPGWVLQGDVFFPFWGQYLIAMTAAIQSGAELPDLTISPEAVLTKDFEIEGTTVAPIGNYYDDDKDIATTLPPLVPVATGNTGGGQGTMGNDYLAATGVLQLFGNVEGVEG